MPRGVGGAPQDDWVSGCCHAAPGYEPCRFARESIGFVSSVELTNARRRRDEKGQLFAEFNVEITLQVLMNYFTR